MELRGDVMMLVNLILLLIFTGFGTTENMTTPAVPHNDSHYDWDEISTYIDNMAVVIFSLVCVLGVLGNGVVIWMTGFRMEKTVNTVWYLGLAVADFLATTFLPLLIAEYALGGHWPFGWFMCKIDALVFHVNMCASVFTLAVISVDRCVCLVCPVWARCSGYRTFRKASWVSLSIWVLSLALSSPRFIFRDTRVVYPDMVLCYDNYALLADYENGTLQEEQLHKFRFSITVITNFVTRFLLPFSIIVSCYSIIVYRLRNNRRSGRSFKIIATVVVLFFLCWLPYHVIYLISIANYDKIVYENTLMRLVVAYGIPITHALALVNSCLNPLLYVFLGQDFKDVFRKSLLKVLEKAFADETDNTPTETDITHPMTTLPGDKGVTLGLPGIRDLSGDCPV